MLAQSKEFPPSVEQQPRHRCASLHMSRNAYAFIGAAWCRRGTRFECLGCVFAFVQATHKPSRTAVPMKATLPTYDPSSREKVVSLEDAL
jgi:hypothetical protein